MNRFTWLLGLGIFGMLAAGIAAQYSGGITIQSTGAAPWPVTIVEPEAISRGVPTQVRLVSSLGSAPQAAELKWRTPATTVVVGTVTLPTERVWVTFPCEGASEGSIVLAALPEQRVIGVVGAHLLAPGVDCAWK